ncbi:MAG TPA: ATP-binding protein [Bacteroidota bacterium]|nr:ATP-binding protein [Bacteroidota bacterium]
MKNPVAAFRLFVRNLGPVEQAQIVASTAVIVSMATIISAMVVTGQTPRLMDFISILTVGTIGFTNVYFSLRYSRQLDEQRRQLLALNTIAEAVTRVVELDVVLRTALDRITELLGADYGWIYMKEGDAPVMKCARGTSLPFSPLHERNGAGGDPGWLGTGRVHRERLDEEPGEIDSALKALGIQFWASVPLKGKDTVAGALIVAGRQYDTFTGKQAELAEAFANQISVALNNAQLFERLKQSEKQYVDLFENAPDIYLSVSRGHIVLGCNTIGAAMLGTKKEDLIGRPFERLFAGERRDAVRQLVDSMFAEGRGLRNAEEQMVRPGGQEFPVTLNASLVFDEKGATVNARIVARDISERKMMEAALLHAQKIDSIGNLAGGIAHDFNNILAAVLGSASIMRRRLTEKSKLYKYVAIIESSARRGSSLTRQLLTFARKTETNVAPVDLNTLIEETLHLFQRSVTKEIDVVTHLTAESVTVNGDDGQLQQALLNIFLNARDAMPEGGTLTIATAVTIADAHTVSQFSSIKPGPFVVITITDTGRGIERSIQNRVFEPFFTTKDSGTGLGLSVVYGVVQSHGGFINLESEVGQGSTFSVYLPRASALPVSAARQRRQRVPHGRENILIIDDEISVCEIARDMLAGLGYTVYVEHDGKSGADLYRIRQAMIDLILLDINMPVMGGKQAFEVLRAINPRCRIIIVTGYGREGVETSKFSSQVNGFMQKPFQLEMLALKVREVLDDRKGATAEAATA